MSLRVVFLLALLLYVFFLPQGAGAEVVDPSSLDPSEREGIDSDGIVLRTIYPPSQCVYCDICGKKVTDGSYTTLKSGKQVCSECMKLEKCAICELPVLPNKRHTVREKVVCEDCFRSADKCVSCGDPIVGKVWEFPGRRKACTWCVEDRSIDHCYVCGVPLKPEGVVYEEARDKYDPRKGTKKLCAHCFKECPKCNSCGKPILGLVYTFESSDGKYCFDCKTQGPFCEVCEVPTHERRDDMWICERCQRNTMSLAQVDSLFSLLVTTLEDSLQFLVWSEIQIEDATRSDMSAIRKGSDLGFVKTEETLSAGFFCYDGYSLAIYLRRGLSSPEALHSLAHEYGHAWQLENAPRVQSRVLSEGLAEWAAYKLMRYLGKKDEAENMLRRTQDTKNGDPYAKGLRLMLDIEERDGIKGLLEYARSHTGFEGRVAPVLGGGGI
jgi:hypothetical protein